MLHIGWRRQSMKIGFGDSITTPVAGNNGCSTLTPAVAGVNVLTHGWL
jgi:hypothetical protein